MTSRNLFFNLQKEDFKRRIWTLALAMLVFFLSFPVATAMQVSNYQDGYYANQEYILEQILRFLSTQNGMTTFITIVGAIICGLSGFFYLHSKKKVDLYHSLPVRREWLFATNYINGLLIYLIPYVINLLLCFVILKINGYMNLEMLTTALAAMAINLLFYSLIYTIVVIAVMLSGNFVVSCLGAGVFLSYGPILTILKEMYFNEFFITYYMDRRGSELLFLSPVGVYVSTASKIGGNGWPYGTLVKVFLATLLLIAFSVYLYKKRPSEAAGKAMAFNLSKPIIKFLLVIPFSLGGGILFRNIVNRASEGWFIFGLIFSLLITHGVIEIIYNFDIRSAFLHKRQILLSAVLTAIIACIFQFDLLGYDKYIPDKDKVKTMSIAISGLEDNLQYFETESGKYSYQSNIDYQLNNMLLEDYEAAYELAKMGVSYVKESTEITNSDHYDGEGNVNFYSVKYVLKNGKEVYRSYRANQEETMKSMKDIYENPEFKQGHYPINKLSIDEISGISSYNLMDSFTFNLTEDEKAELLEIYKKELNALTFEELSNVDPLAEIIFNISDYRQFEYNIYPSFKDTISFLQTHGFDPSKKIKTEDIESIRVMNTTIITEDDSYEREQYYDKVTAEYPDEYGSEYASVDYLDKEQIEEIFTVLRNRYYSWNNRAVVDFNESIEVLVNLSEKQGDYEGSYSFYFREGMIPDYVKKDIAYTGE